jgi:hypothetical protein
VEGDTSLPKFGICRALRSDWFGQLFHLSCQLNSLPVLGGNKLLHVALDRRAGMAHENIRRRPMRTGEMEKLLRTCGAIADGALDEQHSAVLVIVHEALTRAANRLQKAFNGRNRKSKKKGAR